MIGAEDTIVALASARGAAGVAVIRLSGPAVYAVLSAVFAAASADVPPDPAVWQHGRLVYGSVMEKTGEAVDDCLAVVMHGPRSFTGEDVAEIQCHGSPAIITRVLELCVDAGARPAQPGEFSRRAFLNGKMDLAQAEALSDLIASNSESARRLALRQLRGGLSRRLREMNSLLIDAAAEIEAHIDFPEEDIPEMAQSAILERMDAGIHEMEKLLAGHDKARVRREGVRVILAGEPNAGKSSLFNALVGRERAIVSPHAGTTRDTLEATVELGGVAVTLVDTAGIRDDAGEIEQIGIDRAREEIVQADVVLHLAERADGVPPEWPLLDGAEPERVVRVWTKRDNLSGERLGRGSGQDGLSSVSKFARAFVEVSVQSGAGLDVLEQCVLERVLGSTDDESDGEMSRVRHANNLRNALESTQLARMAFAGGESGDLVMVDLRDGLSYIGEILGERLDEQILDRIFSTFCLGK